MAPPVFPSMWAWPLLVYVRKRSVCPHKVTDSSSTAAARVSTFVLFFRPQHEYKADGKAEVSLWKQAVTALR